MLLNTYKSLGLLFPSALCITNSWVDACVCVCFFFRRLFCYTATTGPYDLQLNALEGVCINRPGCKSYPRHRNFPICHMVVNSCVAVQCSTSTIVYSSSLTYVLPVYFRLCQLMMGRCGTWNSQHPIANWIFVTTWLLFDDDDDDVRSMGLNEH